jgi:hypothetical protein
MPTSCIPPSPSPSWLPAPPPPVPSRGVPPGPGRQAPPGPAPTSTASLRPCAGARAPRQSAAVPSARAPMWRPTQRARASRPGWGASGSAATAARVRPHVGTAILSAASLCGCASCATRTRGGGCTQRRPSAAGSLCASTPVKQNTPLSSFFALTYYLFDLHHELNRSVTNPSFVIFPASVILWTDRFLKKRWTMRLCPMTDELI